MAKLSAVIPCFSVTEELKDMALDCAIRIRDQVDELIITDDADRYWPELHQISDLYLLHPKLGYKKNCNLGWKVAHGDFIAQINSDARLLEGNIRDLCVDGIGVPEVIELANETHTSQAVGVFFVTTRQLIESHGGWDTLEVVDWDWSLFDKFQRNGAKILLNRSIKVSHPRAGATSHVARGYKGR